jgi:hypothetical protein
VRATVTTRTCWTLRPATTVRHISESIPLLHPPARLLETVRSTVPPNMAATLDPEAESLEDWGDSDGDAAYVDRPTVRSLNRHIPLPLPLTGVIAEATPC